MVWFVMNIKEQVKQPTYNVETASPIAGPKKVQEKKNFIYKPKKEKKLYNKIKTNRSFQRKRKKERKKKLQDER